MFKKLALRESCLSAARFKAARRQAVAQLCAGRSFLKRMIYKARDGLMLFQS
jgi:hypothetical protein